MRSSPKPNANPVNSSESMPTPSSTLGSTIPHPPSSSHPEPKHTRQPSPPQKMQLTASSADGSV